MPETTRNVELEENNNTIYENSIKPVKQSVISVNGSKNNPQVPIVLDNKKEIHIDDILSIKDEEIIDKDEEDDEDNDSDDSPKFRDKNKELKQMIKEQLSEETQEAIDIENEAMDEIIEKLKRRGLSKDNGIELQKMRTINRGNRVRTH